MNGSLSSRDYRFKAGRQIARGMDGVFSAFEKVGAYSYKATASMKFNSAQKEYHTAYADFCAFPFDFHCVGKFSDFFSLCP